MYRNPENGHRLRLISYVVIIYLLLAFSWWAILLYVKNNDAFYAKAAYMELIQKGTQRVHTSEEFYMTSEYIELKRKYEKQELMIFGEAMVFILSLIAGIYFINRGYYREVQLARQKKNFLMSVTHELKSPLASIRLVLETIQKRDLTDQQKKQLTESAIKENDRLTSVVHNLLTATRLDTMYQANLELMSLSKVVKDEISRMKMIFPERKISLDCEENLPELYFDRAGMVSVISNLVENAIKYSSIKDEVRVTLSGGHDCLKLRVFDNGTGVAPEEKIKIFEQFYRSGNEETRNTKGTGLGLYIVKQIVLAHHGRITVHENTPKGSIFEVSLPLKIKNGPKDSIG